MAGRFFFWPEWYRQIKTSNLTHHKYVFGIRWWKHTDRYRLQVLKYIQLQDEKLMGRSIHVKVA